MQKLNQYGQVHTCLYIIFLCNGQQFPCLVLMTLLVGVSHRVTPARLETSGQAETLRIKTLWLCVSVAKILDQHSRGKLSNIRV